jgi:TetR/AcrR family transcriptional repressor of nem operon
VREYLESLGRLIARPERETDGDEAFLTLSALVGAVSMARAVDDRELSDEILARTARALHRQVGDATGGGPPSA